MTLNEAGDVFLHFQTLTFVPFDLKAIERSMLAEEEIAWLNDYHRQVRQAVLPYLKDDGERAYVLEATEAI